MAQEREIEDLQYTAFLRPTTGTPWTQRRTGRFRASRFNSPLMPTQVQRHCITSDPRSRVTLATLIQTELAAHSGQGVFMTFNPHSIPHQKCLACGVS